MAAETTLKIHLPEHQTLDLPSPHTRLQQFALPFLRLAELTGRWPRKAFAVLASISLLMAFGLTRLSTDDALESFLKANTPAYQTFERMRAKFPSSDLDIFVAVEADNLFTRENLTAMQELDYSLLLAEPVKSVLSIFSLKEPLQADRLPASIIPDEIPDDTAALRRLAEQVGAHPLVGGRLLSNRDKAGQLALFVVGLDRDYVRTNGLPDAVESLRSELASVTGDAKLSVGIAGVPAMKAEVIAGTARDIVTFNAAGLLVGAMICWVFFRTFPLVLIANAPALLAIVFCLGLFGWTGTRIDPLMNAVMPLVIVVTFNNAMHFLFAICRNLDADVGKAEAISQSIMEIGPACALTSITTSIALLSLGLSSSPLISTFGAMAGACVLIALVLVTVTMPLLAIMFLQSGQGYLRDNNPYHGVRLLNRVAALVSKFVARTPAGFVVAGVFLTLMFFAAYIQLQPQYRLSDMLPDKGEAASVTKRMASRLSGVFPLNALVRLPRDISLSDPQALAILDDVHQALSNHPSITKVSSLSDLQRWAESGGMPPEQASSRLLETLPSAIKQRFIDSENRLLLVSGYIDDLEAKQVLKISAEVELSLAGLRARHPDLEVNLTGLSATAAARSTDVISQLSLSMIGAIIVVVIVIGLAFHSFAMAGLSVVPNLFALFATGTWLLTVHGGLDYATIVGLTVAFGLAVDDTIHVLNRYEIEMYASQSTAAATDRTLRLIGTVLILTTIVLVAGLSVTQLSAVPPTRQFGLICILTLIFALIADLVILPALILVTGRAGIRPGGKLSTRKITAAAEGAATKMMQ